MESACGVFHAVEATQKGAFSASDGPMMATFSPSLILTRDTFLKLQGLRSFS